MTLGLILSTSAFALPSYLEGAIVTVTLKNGKTYSFKSEEYAVVKRDQMGQAEEEQASPRSKKEKKNRVYATAGHGLNGNQDVSKSGNVHSVSPSSGARVGAGYMRKVSDDLNLGVQIKTNGDIDLTVGTDF